jgi:hypothetical protein
VPEEPLHFVQIHTVLDRPRRKRVVQVVKTEILDILPRFYPFFNSLQGIFPCGVLGSLLMKRTVFGAL